MASKYGPAWNCPITGKRMSQMQDELEAFLKLLKEHSVETYLEIGLRTGGTFGFVGRETNVTAMVGVDMPGSAWGTAGTEAALKRVADDLMRRGKFVTVVFGDSHALRTLEHVKDVQPRYDCVFIDADHSEEAVRQDWADYGPLGRIVAFHDIDAWNFPSAEAGNYRERYGVPKLWAELKQKYQTVEIVGKQRGYGIGVLFT